MTLNAVIYIFWLVNHFIVVAVTCFIIFPEPDPSVCGTKGRAFILVREEDGADVEEESEGELVEAEEEESEMSEDDMPDSAHMSDEDEQREHEFKREMMESLTNALRESSAAENVVLEINASRHAYNMSMEDVLTTVTQGIIRVSEDKLWEVVTRRCCGRVSSFQSLPLHMSLKIIFGRTEIKSWF
ncbi:translation initiation factor eIF2B subunit epsilon-like isoform X1 [Procambarus clarkii]|uniref:translation initiation factor eIF2B subunit epsilon-like isoform X1 n=1 Tax=Procambarus clarkii TaxID=6728 RepID=UPI003742014A